MPPRQSARAAAHSACGSHDVDPLGGQIDSEATLAPPHLSSGTARGNQVCAQPLTTRESNGNNATGNKHGANERVTTEQLMNKHFAPMKYVIPGVIVEGAFQTLRNEIARDGSLKISEAAK
jgi:hypothetical protein